MEQRQGLFLVLEGADGSGKATQFSLLAERLKAMGYELEVFDFPRYEEASSHFVRQYLNGAYGPASSISPYTASIFYALDRYEAAPRIKKALEEGKIVLANRYVGSNMAHQGSKFSDGGQQRGFFVWEDGLEYSLLGIPRPDINIFLRVPAETAYELIGRKKARSYTSRTRDEHEADIEHLRKSVETYDTLSRLFPRDFKTIQCTEGGRMLSILEINNRIWDIVRPILPTVKPRPGAASVVRLDKLGGSDELKRPKKQSKDSGRHKEDRGLKLHITNVSLFAADFLAAAPGITVNETGKSGMDAGGHYQLSKLSKDLAFQHQRLLRGLKEAEESVRKHLGHTGSRAASETASLLTSLRPLSTLVDVDVSGSGKSIQKLVDGLSAQPYEELQWLSRQIALSAKEHDAQIRPPEDVRTGKGRSALKDYTGLFMEGSVKFRETNHREQVELIAFSPRNEFDLIVESLYAKLDAPREEIVSEIYSWPYERKAKVLDETLSADPAVKSKASYRVDINASMLLVRLWAEKSGVDISFQPPTTRHGYDLPPLAQAEPFKSIYDTCFDLSQEAYENFRKAGREDALPYLTLRGHRRNAVMSFTLRDLEEMLRTASVTADRSIVNALLDKIAEVHPIASERLAAKTKVDSATKSARATRKSAPTRAKMVKKPKQ